jgi:hypothetical protein
MAVILATWEAGIRKVVSRLARAENSGDPTSIIPGYSGECLSSQGTWETEIRKSEVLVQPRPAEKKKQAHNLILFLY